MDCPKCCGEVLTDGQLRECERCQILGCLNCTILVSGNRLCHDCYQEWDNSCYICQKRFHQNALFTCDSCQDSCCLNCLAKDGESVCKKCRTFCSFSRCSQPVIRSWKDFDEYCSDCRELKPHCPMHKTHPCNFKDCKSRVCVDCAHKAKLPKTYCKAHQVYCGNCGLRRPRDQCQPCQLAVENEKLCNKWYCEGVCFQNATVVSKIKKDTFCRIRTCKKDVVNCNQCSNYVPHGFARQMGNNSWYCQVCYEELEDKYVACELVSGQHIPNDIRGLIEGYL